MPHSATVLSRWASKCNEARSVPSKVQRARSASLEDGQRPIGRGATGRPGAYRTRSYRTAGGLQDAELQDGRGPTGRGATGRPGAYSLEDGRGPTV